MNKGIWATYFSEGMTMRSIVAAALATGFLLASVGIATADDTVRLGGPAAQAAIQGGTNIELVHGRYGRSYYGGGYGRSYYGGGYGRSYYGGGYYPRTCAYYSPSYYYPASYSYYTPSYYYPSYYYRPACNYYRIADGSIPTAVTPTNVYYQMPMQPSPGSFPYNGGPSSLVPMPSPTPDINPASKPGGVLPLDGRLVSLPTQMTGGTMQISVPQQTVTPRVSYPAYGEEPIVPAPRKTR